MSDEGCKVRSLHPYAYRSGEWATVQVTLEWPDRRCWLVTFDDGDTDLWPVDDPSADWQILPPSASVN